MTKKNVNIEKYHNNIINGTFIKKQDVKWKHFIVYVVLHTIALYGFITFPYYQKKKLILWSIFLSILANFGISGGAHRYWSHRSFKATLPLKIILTICFFICGHYSISRWIKDHYLHHKYVGTNADPHNASRGFWFCHIGWLVLEKHPEVIKKEQEIDLSNIYADPVTRFAEKYFHELQLIFCFVLPVIIPVYFWKESWYYAILSQVFMRYTYTLNCLLSINSFSHMFGTRPYDKKNLATENKIVSFFASGEGWHNYHHTFPTDYKAAEFGNHTLNLTAFFIDFFAKIGWAYDLKRPSKELVKSVILNRGDGSHPVHKIEMSNMK